jgi:hypothetical protein
MEDSNESVVDSKGELRSANLLALKLRDQQNIDLIKNDPDVLNQLAKQAVEATDKISEESQFRRAFESDRQVYRYTVQFLGVTVLFAVTGIIVIAMTEIIGKHPNVKMPDALVAIASAAVGALAGLLSPIAINRR